MKIYVAGHRGLVGSAIVREIESKAKHTWIGKTRDELDLLDRKAVFDYVSQNKPDAMVIAAAKVGGIKANSNFPVEFLSQNLQIETNLIDAASAAGIEKVLFLGSSCIYPKLSPQPIKEEYLLTGELEPTNEPYAIAKIAGLKLISAYRSEYDRNWISAMPTNMYGPGDNFDLDNAHVLPALIRRLHEAKSNQAKSLTLWGTGNPKREFLHADDLAAACLFMIEEYSGEVALNVGTGTDVSIKELATLISYVVGYEGEIQWDDTKPDGTPRKLLDVSKINELGWSAKIDLESGIRSTYEWFLKNHA